MNSLLNGMDIFTKDVILGVAAVFIFLVFWWFYIVTSLIKTFLKAAQEVLGGTFTAKGRLKGTYKGREVLVGVIFSGFKGEFMPFPHIQMRLREAIGYNTNRLPNYAVIEKGYLVYKVKLSVLWGVFDKNFPQVFSKNYLIISLEKLLATAEDVERGRTIKEVFK